MKNIARVLQIGIPFFWAGAVLAISFMEAPLKFNAPNLTRQVALEVGHIVFDALNKLEIILALLFALTFFLKPKKSITFLFGVVATLLLAQTVWLFPLLDERTLAIIDGREVPPSSLHIIYIVLEVIKFLGLIGLGVSVTTNNRTQPRQDS